MLPSRGRTEQIQRIADVMSGFDIVGLQETDAGSYRTNGIDQIEQLAMLAGHSEHSFLLNRNMGRLAQHGIAITGNRSPSRIEHHALPGRVRGRGVIFAEYGQGDDALCVAVTHLALSRHARVLQLEWLAARLARYRHVILMGDMNCEPFELANSALGEIGLYVRRDQTPPMTYPSWRPRRCIDHVLTSETLAIRRSWIPSGGYSDHLPIAAEIILPAPLHWLCSKVQ